MSRNLVIARALILLAFAIAAFAGPAPAEASAFVVNTTDERSDGRCDSTHCSLREAIEAANDSPGPDTIRFAIPGAGPHRIVVEADGLPALTDHQTRIDATTQPGYAGAPLIVLDGGGAIPATVAIRIASSDNVIVGFSLVGFDALGASAILVDVGTGNTIDSNYIGLHPDGTAEGNYNGINFDFDSTDNLAARNIISGNDNGIIIYAGTQRILGNRIGTDPAGERAIPNLVGISIGPNATGTVIGSPREGDGNLISGNDVGLRSEGGREAVIQGNYVGTNAAGDAALPNGAGIGLSLTLTMHPSGGGANLVGGNMEAGEGNVIAGNESGVGVWRSPDNIIRGNWIGVNKAGTPIPNRIGVDVTETEGTVIGGLGPGEGNTIAHNTGSGVHIEARRTAVIGNLITENGGDGVELTWDWHPVDEIYGNTISRNSITLDGGLGIRFDDPGLNNGIDPPIIKSARLSTVSGHACSRCLIEIFVADDDPSGAGEGPTYLTTVEASVGGGFTTTLPHPQFCRLITATATDADGNTSPFARNVPTLCLILRPWVIIGWIIGLGITGGLAGRLFARGPRPGLPALVGGGVGVAAGVLTLFLPFVHVDLDGGAPPTESRTASTPPCTQYLDPARIEPMVGEVFPAGSEIGLSVVPPASLSGDATRWTFFVTAPYDGEFEGTSDGPATTLTQLGLDPAPEGTYRWQLAVERRDSQTGTWTTFCSGLPGWFFHVAAVEPAIERTTPSPTPTATPTPTPQAEAPTATLRQNANCRAGPGNVYRVITSLVSGNVAYPIVGRSQDSAWWVIQAPGLTSPCWIWGGSLDIASDVAPVPAVAAPPTPTPAPTSTPEQGCWIFNPNLQQNICVSPCPPNPNPGGACTP